MVTAISPSLFARPLDPAPPLDEGELPTVLPPPHSVTAGGWLGASDFWEGRLAASVRVLSSLRLSGDFVRTHVASTQYSTEFSGSVAWNFLEAHEIDLSAAETSGTISLQSQMWSAEYRFDFASLWQGDRLVEGRIGIDHHNYFGPQGRDAFSTWGYRAGLTFEPIDQLSVGLSGVLYSSPTLSALWQQYIGLVLLIAARNPDLLPQEWSATGSVNYELTRSDELRVGLTVFQTLNSTVLNYNPSFDWVHKFAPEWSAGLTAATTAASGRMPSTKLGAELTFRFGKR